jgi:hypothetical protein
VSGRLNTGREDTVGPQNPRRCLVIVDFLAISQEMREDRVFLLFQSLEPEDVLSCHIATISAITSSSISTSTFHSIPFRIG